jgi:hypothetical protein
VGGVGSSLLAGGGADPVLRIWDPRIPGKWFRLPADLFATVESAVAFVERVILKDVQSFLLYECCNLLSAVDKPLTN